jgi:hypothetical protein
MELLSQVRSRTRGGATGLLPVGALAGVTTIAVAAAASLLAYGGGGYGLAVQGMAVCAVWGAVAIGVAAGVFPRSSLSKSGWAMLAGCVGLTAWTLTSILWSSGVDAPFSAFVRMALYTGVVALALLATSRGGSAAWVNGLALAAVVVEALALVSRLFPGSLTTGFETFAPGWVTRLSYPLGYWNGLAMLLGVAAPLLLRIATSSRSRVRWLALVPLPGLAVVIYLASSRGGVITAVVGVAVYLVLAPDRWRLIGVIAGAGLAAAGAVAYVSRQHQLVNVPLGHGVAAQGRDVALALLVLGVAAAGLAACFDLALRRVVVPRVVSIAVVLAAIVVAVGGIVALHPAARVSAFARAPAPGTLTIDQHILSGNSTGRWQLWSSGIDEFRASNPILGGGAGSYAGWWAEHASIPVTVQNAHSLYVETLAELGIIGTLFALLILAPPIWLAARSVRLDSQADRGLRSTQAALGGAFAAFLFGNGFDWIWQLPAVAAIGLAAGALLCATSSPPRLRTTRFPGPRTRLAVTLISIGAIGLGGLVLATESRLTASMKSAQTGDVRPGLAAAADARALEPWSARPSLQLALLAEQAGDLATGRAWIAEAVRRSPSDWHLWVIKARIDTEAGAVRAAVASLRRARLLNPQVTVIRGASPG